MPRYIETEAFEKDIRKRYCKPCEQDGRDYHGVKCWACEIDDMLGEVADAPTADVQEVKRGHWIHSDLILNRSVCSVFNFRTDEIDYAIMKYCPFCGAKMDEEEEEK